MGNFVFHKFITSQTVFLTLPQPTKVRIAVFGPIKTVSSKSLCKVICLFNLFVYICKLICASSVTVPSAECSSELATKVASDCPGNQRGDIPVLVCL